MNLLGPPESRHSLDWAPAAANGDDFKLHLACVYWGILLHAWHCMEIGLHESADFAIKAWLESVWALLESRNFAYA